MARLPAADERQVRRPSAPVVARRQDDRLRHRPRQARASTLLKFKPWRIALLDVATGAIDRRCRIRRAEPQSAVGARRPVHRLRVRSHRHRQPLPLRSRRAASTTSSRTSPAPISALTEYSPAISWARQARSPGVHVLRERAIHHLDGEQSARAAEGAVPRAARPRRRRRRRAATDTIDRSRCRSPRCSTRSTSALPDTTSSDVNPYHVRFQPDYVDAAEHRLRARRVRTQRVRWNDARAERHARQQPSRDLRRGQRPGERGARFLGYTNLSHRWQFSTGSRKRRTTSCRPTRCRTRWTRASRSRIRRSRRTSRARRSASRHTR